MKHCLAALALFPAVAVAAPAQPLKPPVTKDMARKAIALFREEPASEAGRGAASIILRFAEESPDVEVVIAPPFLPWFADKPAMKHGDTLMAAYLAGTILSQLDSGAAKFDPVAGAEQVIETYEKLKKAKPDLRIPSVETLIELKAQGKLKEHLSFK